MDAQQIFDRVVSHLLIQNTKSMNAVGMMCRYRGQNGTKCAVGALIPEKEYKKTFEGQTVSGLLTLSDFAKRNFEEHRLLLTELQSVHDSNEPKLWEQTLQVVAKKCYLNYNGITAQGLFDYILNFLRTQGAPSAKGVNCLYRGAENRKCAAGCLIPDADYRRSFEGDCWELVAKYFYKYSQFTDLIVACQEAHDSWAIGISLESEFAKVASTFKLGYQAA